ncbi:MAG: T9SS type A sorting domain-containing protein [Janthinobacterium lividum]
MRLTNAYGQPVRQQQAQPGRLHLDVRNLPAGLYFLELRDAAGKTVRKQIRIAR